MPDERIPAWRTIVAFPDIYAEGEKERLQEGHFIHELGRVCNISSDWNGILREGLLSRRQQAIKTLEDGRGDADFLRAAIGTIGTVIAYADRYEIPGLSESIRYGAKSFLGALQTMRILHFSLWASNVYHNTLGRFDQYMWPYLKADMEAGIYDEKSALSLLEEFFLSFNRDSDLYVGMQQGDNGQSLMLGGCDREGKCAVNPLTHLCLAASLNNRSIDPKINLRVDKNTPQSLYERCTELTKQGLGFPQYANDDVVIPALVKLGYDIEDAREYTVAACWEFIIPGVAMDIPNIGAMPLATVVNNCIRHHLKECETYGELEAVVMKELNAHAISISESLKGLWVEPAPFQSVLMSGCMQDGQDISLGAKYNNYGIHGTGFSNAVDQLAAIKYLVYETKQVTSLAMTDALANSFKDNQSLLNTLRTTAPKLGRDEYAEPIADFLLNAFADSLADLRNERGGIFRAGTGSAMYYVWHARNLDVLADGHLPEEPLSANFSPSLLVTDAGPLSVIRAFARPGLSRVINGGPLTLELHDTVFRNHEGLVKVAQLVRSFILLGGHQLQLNAVSRETLLDAQANPDTHHNLIVRVWGWSGHFVQLDKSYQDQIIVRTSYHM